jgi:hypothetical protein
VIQSVVRERESARDAELEAFYAENRDYYGPRLRCARSRARGAGASGRGGARAPPRRPAGLRGGEAFEKVMRRWRSAGGDPARDPPLLTLARVASVLPLGASRWRSWEGEGQRACAQRRYTVLRPHAREPVVLPLAEVREELRIERRRAGDTALRRYLDEQRERADARGGRAAVSMWSHRGVRRCALRAARRRRAGPHA